MFLLPPFFRKKMCVAFRMIHFALSLTRLRSLSAEHFGVLVSSAGACGGVVTGAILSESVGRKPSFVIGFLFAAVKAPLCMSFATTLSLSVRVSRCGADVHSPDQFASGRCSISCVCNDLVLQPTPSLNKMQLTVRSSAGISQASMKLYGIIFLRCYLNGILSLVTGTRTLLRLILLL